MLLTSSELKLFPLSPCFQKAKTLSCKQTVRRFHMLLNCQQQQQQLLLSDYSLSNVLPIVSMGKPKTSSVDGTPWRLTIWTVSVQQISRFYGKEDFKSWFRLRQACQTCSRRGTFMGSCLIRPAGACPLPKSRGPTPRPPNWILSQHPGCSDKGHHRTLTEKESDLLLAMGTELWPWFLREPNSLNEGVRYPLKYPLKESLTVHINNAFELPDSLQDPTL